jgi:serine protease Do
MPLVSSPFAANFAAQSLSSYLLSITAKDRFMQIPASVRAHQRLVSVLATLVLLLSPLGALLQHTPAFAATASIAPLAAGRASFAVDPADSDLQLVANQAVTTTTALTGTRGSGLSLPRLSLPKNTGSETGDSETGTDVAENAAEGADPETTAADEATETMPDAVANLADVRGAVIQIEAVGSFVDPAEGLQLNAAGRGSGFIIDPSGIAVTNNHVVTGGGLYKVYLDGEDEPRNAKVLGVSECADLAVIDIQGDGFPYLDWYEGRIRVGLDVYAVGFPLGDPEYTMTRGIVAKERAAGDSSWASVDQVLQHDADINPGNSGGPLVDADGRVVGVNYAGDTETNQYFAISRDEALTVIDQLRTGINVDSIGINGEAINNGEGLSGLWVASVKSGSPADRTGIKGGDIILSMEGLVLAEDGTMATYCDILRSHSAEDVLAVEVLRFDTEEVLEGQINGRELTTSFSIADELAPEESADSTGNGESTTAAPGYSEYAAITDRTGILSLEVPTEWADVASDDWVWNEETVGIRLLAATDIDEFLANWGYPGVIFSFSTTLVENNTPEDLLDGIQYTSSCTYDGRSEIPDGFFTGAYDIWKACKGEQNEAIIVALVPETGDYSLLLEIYLASDADVEAVDRILDSFIVDVEKLPSATTNSSASTTGNESIFDLVDTTGLIYDYTFVNELALSAILPADWVDISSNDWVDEDEEELGYTLSASSDIAAYNDTWNTAGLYARSTTGLVEELDIDDLLDAVDLRDTCTYDDRYTHSHTIYGITYNGAYDLYTNCDGEDNAFAYLVVQSDDLDQAVLLEFLAVTEADVEAFGILLQSFYIGAVDESAAETEESAESDYVVITDESETLVVRVPVAWTDITSGDWELDGAVVGVQLEASIDLASYNESWTTPGLFFGASTEFNGSEPQEILDLLDFSADCTLSDRFEYDDNVFAGHYDLWEECGDTETSIVFLATVSKENPDYLALIGVQLPSDEDFATLDEIFKSFNLNLPTDGASNSTPTAEVVVDALNVRSGPGTGYARVGGATRGEELIVIGEYNNCAWLNVQTRSELVGWVSGSAQYVNFTTDCAEIPAVEPPAPPQNSGSNPRSGSAGASGAVSGKGCYTFQNQVGPELTITFTRRGDGWNVTFKVPPDGENRQCFDPGDYTYTMDAPPPWDSVNGELAVGAGDNFLFPITPSE